MKDFKITSNILKLFKNEPQKNLALIQKFLVFTDLFQKYTKKIKIVLQQLA